MLWLVSPSKTDVYNGFATPQPADSAAENRLYAFHHDADETAGANSNGHLGLADLSARAGRLAMETGQFWQQESRVTRKSSVDHRLLRDMTALEHILVDAGLHVDKAQALIGRSVFAKYLLDRKIISEKLLSTKFGAPSLQDVFRNEVAAGHLFNWLSTKFNGDIFSPQDSDRSTKHLGHVAEFLDGTDFETGQKSLFPYYFDIIPVELISAIYEQFVHTATKRKDSSPQEDKPQDVHYTPLAAVFLVLDEVMQGITGHETVLDITCGSGVFLVEALRRLVKEKASGKNPTRAMIRQVLHQQIYGVDISPPAVRIAAFSLYLAALELDPNPHLTDDMKFNPLIGTNLLVGDAHDIENTPKGKAALSTKSGLKKFDIIIGNPPWSYQGRGGTRERQARMAGQDRQPRGVSLDFVERAKHFAHEQTRLGMIVSATLFFSRSDTGRTATQKLVESLAPLTLINLASQAVWLFPKAKMPAMALIARYKEQNPAHMQIVQVPWSQAGANSHSFEMVGTDVQTLHMASWRRNPDLMKASFLGKLHDHLLLEHLSETQENLKQRLGAIGTAMKMGFTLGNQKDDANFLRDIPYLAHGLLHFSMPRDLPKFRHQKAEHPRDRKIYHAPLLIMDEYLKKSSEDPRPIVALAEKDTVFTKRHFGVSFPTRHAEVAPLLAGILSSSLAAWYFLMAGSTFGLWKRLVLQADVNALPTPDLESAVGTKAGREIRLLVRSFQGRVPIPDEWWRLDEAVLDLYELDDGERAVVRDGLFRASWQWKNGRQKSVAPAQPKHLKEYAKAFAAKIDPWLQAGQKHRLRAEIHENPSPSDPLRLVRFVLEQRPPPSVVQVAPSDGLAHDVLVETAGRLGVDVEDELSRFGELRLSGKDEVVIVKPAARRHWLAVNAFADARAVLDDSLKGGLG